MYTYTRCMYMICTVYMNILFKNKCTYIDTSNMYMYTYVYI